MTQDDAFANAAYITGGMGYPDDWAAQAAAFRDAGRCDLDLAYGDGARQVFDLFHPAAVPKGVVVFVHGGYWRMFDKSYWSHLAAGPVAQGWAVAIPSYDLCPAVGIAAITRQIRSAIAVIAARVPGGGLRLCGHSAGGHLVARMLDPAVQADPAEQAAWAARIERVVPISPVADLVPLIDTAMNADFRLDVALARAESPVFQPPPQVPVTVWVGADERPVFVQQAKALAAAWGCACRVEPARHHFDVIDGLTQADSALTRAVLAQG